MKIFAQFTASLVGSIVLGLAGLVVGAYIGGNFGFPITFGGNVGYEAGGAFCAIIGISLGCLLGQITVNKLIHKKQKYKTASIAAITTAVIGIMLFDYNMPQIVGLIILLLPATVLTAVTNWKIS